jgi:hypothetical protein
MALEGNVEGVTSTTLETLPMASSEDPVAREISSIKARVSIKKPLVSLMVSFISLYVIQAFPLCKNALLLSFSGEST